MEIAELAKVCHEANRAYCQALGDNSQPAWEEAPEWLRTSVINGVKFHLMNPGLQASHNHGNWLKEKEATGWKYGPINDLAKKEHPCLMPYDELPAEQKAKDMLFIGVVNALRAVSGFIRTPHNEEPPPKPPLTETYIPPTNEIPPPPPSEKAETFSATRVMFDRWL